jgi:hypothetical protein
MRDFISTLFSKPNINRSTTVYLAPRQTLDWASVRELDELEPERFDALVERRAGTTRRLIGLWNDSLKKPFWQVRAEIKAITREQWNGLDRAKLIDDLPGDLQAASEILERIQQDAWIIPIDDDDWLAPSVPEQLCNTDTRNTDGAVWENLKVAETVEHRPGSNAFCFTNNYAVSASAIGTKFQWSDVYQHFSAQSRFFGEAEPALTVAHLPKAQSAANKHPCCFTYLERTAAETNESPAGLRAGVRSYCSGIRSCLEQGWAADTSHDWLTVPLRRQLRTFEDCL